MSPHVDCLFRGRRKFLGSAASLAMGLAAGRTFAQQQASDQRSLMNRETRDGIKRGLDFLARRQNEEGCFGTAGYPRNVAVSSLAAMAWMAQGSTPGRGPYGPHVNASVSYVLANCQESGFITAPGAASHGPMYGHGFATLFLAEVYGMSPDSGIREKLDRAVKLIITTQNAEGGWRYHPERADADVSVTICQVMALRAARNAGIFVPSETIDRCTDYVKRMQNIDGGFSYMVPGTESQFPRTAAGIVALYSAGIYDGEEVSSGIEYLMQNIPQSDAFSSEPHYFYGHYYAVQALWHAGGNDWARWYESIHNALLAQQKQDGSWFDQICPEYGTAMACLILQMPNNYLPIFQR